MRLVSLILIVALFAASCGKSKVINGIEYKPVGIASKYVPHNLVKTTYSDEIQYDICWGNVVWGIVLCETVIAPIYFFGFSMFNPISEISKNQNNNKK